MRDLHAVNKPRRGAVGALVAVLASACFVPPTPPDEGALKVGALLPYTGDVAATGANIEKAILGVIQQVNDAGGIAGKPLRVVARDTHSDLKRGLNEAEALLDDGVLAILGPQDEEVGAQFAPLAREKKVVVISGGVTSPLFTALQDDGFWFRTCPAARQLSTALVDRMEADGIRSAAVVYIGDMYGSAMAAILTNLIAAAGIQAPAPISFQPGETNYSAYLRPLLHTNPQAIVLIAYAKSGAEMVQEWNLLGGQARWYLGPTLKADVFVDNVMPGALEGAVGIAPALADDANRFADDFADRWDGDVPLDPAYFYHDATAILVLAMARASKLAGGRVPTGAEIRDQVGVVAGAPGEVVTWEDLERGLRLAGNGQDIDYRGASGPVDLDAAGDVVNAGVRLWTIRDHRIENL